MIRLPLPSRASAADHCAECDGPRDLHGLLCSDCVDASFLQRLEWRYQNGEGLYSLLYRETDRGAFSVERQLHPLEWKLGAEVHIGDGSFAIVLALGPWSAWAGWQQ